MQKAIEIRNKAVADLLAHAKYEIRNIIDYRIRLGEMEENPDEEYYEVPVSGFGGMLRCPTVEVTVTNTYDESVCNESRCIEEFIDLDGTVSIRTEEGDEISLRELSFDNLVDVVTLLEDMWSNLITNKTK
jgi:hypothetical protein